MGYRAGTEYCMSLILRNGTMKARIQQRLDSLEGDLDTLFHELDHVDQRSLSIRPDNGGWNVLQIIEHLRMAEFHSYNYILNKAKVMEQLPKKDLLVKWRELNLQLFLNSPFKFKAPAIVNEESFPEELNYDHQKIQWKGSRIEMKEWLIMQPDHYFHLQAYRHPLAGRMGIDGMLKFFHLHFVRHSKQIKRTLVNAAR